MDLYNLLILSRHSIFRPIRRFLRLSRPSYQLWTDASGKGYGGHLGPATEPLAIYQHDYIKKLKLSLPERRGRKPTTLDPDDIQLHEATALFLCLQRWRLLLRGSTVEAFTDNWTVHGQYMGMLEGPKSTMDIMNAIRELVKTEDIDLKVTWIGRSHNKTADRLSKLSGPDDPNYLHGIRMLLEMGKAEPKRSASLLVRRIMAADEKNSP